MQIPKKSSYVTVEEYLTAEECATVKHEYLDGQVYAMTGATGRHRTIVGNIYSALRMHLKGSNCRADFVDAQVNVVATNSIYYPDVVVSCGEFDEESMAVSNPVLIVEVLSRSTAAIDKREKLFAYRKVPTLKEYLIVHQRSKHVEVYRKDTNDKWNLVVYRQGEAELESIPCGGFRLGLDVIYEDVTWLQDKDPHVTEEGANYDLGQGELDW